MSDQEMTVFISYRRRTDEHLAGRIFDHLHSHGYDVFLDVITIDNGEIDRIILNQIAARAHFVLLLSPGSLLRCANEDDWLRWEIGEAFRLKRNIIPIFNGCLFNLEEERLPLPEPLRTELPLRNGLPLYHYYFDEAMNHLRTRFLKRPIYDILVTPTPNEEQSEVAERIARVVATPPDVTDILPQLFEWCKIPKGSVTLADVSSDLGSKGGRFEVPAFSIAKYPITNAQYQRFADAEDGYWDVGWWDYSPEARNWRAEHPTPTKTAFEGDDLPRTNISWYAALAFCRWLSEKSGQEITLPTEQQWQRAAQGDNQRDYPWGSEQPRASRCNYNDLLGHTTPVTRYPEGATPEGLMDMGGNVWEWCLTKWGTDGTSTDGNNHRVYRGGSWGSHDAHVRAASRAHPFGGNPDREGNSLGFRIARSL